MRGEIVYEPRDGYGGPTGESSVPEMEELPAAASGEFVNRRENSGRQRQRGDGDVPAFGDDGRLAEKF